MERVNQAVKQATEEIHNNTFIWQCLFTTTTSTIPFHRYHNHRNACYHDRCHPMTDATIATSSIPESVRLEKKIINTNNNKNNTKEPVLRFPLLFQTLKKNFHTHSYVTISIFLFFDWMRRDGSFSVKSK